MSRIRGVPPATIAIQPYFPINAAQRAAAAAVSPAARELQPILTDPAFLANATGAGCATLGICDDLTGGWMPWALRDAARLTGHADTALDLQSYFRAVTDQINAACSDGRLTCAPALPSALQPFQSASISDTLRSAAYWLVQLPINRDYYAWSFDDQEPFPLSAADRARLQEGISGVPVNAAEAAAQVSRFDELAWVYTSLSCLSFVAFVVMLLLSLVGGILGFRWRHWWPANPALRILSISLLVGVASRLIIFAVIATTQYDIAAKYHNPTRTFLLAAAAIGVANLVPRLRRFRDYRSVRVVTRSAVECPPSAAAMPG